MSCYLAGNFCWPNSSSPSSCGHDFKIVCFNVIVKLSGQLFLIHLVSLGTQVGGLKKAIEAEVAFRHSGSRFWTRIVLKGGLDCSLTFADLSPTRALKMDTRHQVMLRFVVRLFYNFRQVAIWLKMNYYYFHHGVSLSLSPLFSVSQKNHL